MGILLSQKQLGQSSEVKRNFPVPSALRFQNPSGVESGGEIKLTKTSTKSPSSSNLKNSKQISPLDMKEEVGGEAERLREIFIISLPKGKLKLIKLVSQSQFS